MLDWSMWSRHRRREWKQRVDAVGACALLHYVATPPSVAIARALSRHDSASHTLTEADVLHMVSLFEAPDESEGFTIAVH